MYGDSRPSVYLYLQSGAVLFSSLLVLVCLVLFHRFPRDLTLDYSFSLYGSGLTRKLFARGAS